MGSSNRGAIRMELDQYLRDRLEQLKGERVAAVEPLELVNDKIAKADAKCGARSKTEHYRKWSLILLALESDLDNAKTLLTSVEAEIAEKGEKLAEYQRRVTEEGEYRENRLQDSMNMDADEQAALPLENMALLQEYETRLVEDTAQSSDEANLEEEISETVENEIDVASEEDKVSEGIAEQSRHDETSDLVKPPSRDQGHDAALASDEDRKTFGKVLTQHVSGRLQEITFHEYETFMKISAMILQNPAGDDRSLRVKGMTSAAIHDGSEECRRLLETMSVVLSNGALDRAAS